MEIREIENIEPKEIMSWFKKLCAIPRGTYHEQEVSKWVAEQCKNAGCDVKTYPSGMILARQKATPGCENWPVVLLQSHLDMVLAKTEDCTKDLTKEGIEPYYDTATGTIRAFGTTLGADNGAGVATQLAIIHNPSIIHGPIEHLFTVAEEDLPGKCIIDDIQNGDITAKYYLNIDNENFEEIIYGGAGCTTLKLNSPLQQVDNNSPYAFSIALSGLSGGHSGVNIVKPHINAIEFIAQCAIDFAELNKVEFMISKFEGGPINNSLPIYCKLDVIMEPKLFEKFKRFLINQLIIAKKVCQGYEDGAVLDFNNHLEPPKKAYPFELAKRIFLFASLAPNKMFTPSKNGKNMFSSSNLGFMSIEDQKLRMDFKIRSFLNGEIQSKVRKIESLGKLLGFTEFEQQGQLYAFINDVTHNHLADIYGQCYQEVVGKPIVKATCPAGLECAVVCLKNPTMTQNTICIAPTILSCHSPNEALNIQSTVQFWKVLKKTLALLKE